MGQIQVSTDKCSFRSSAFFAEIQVNSYRKTAQETQDSYEKFVSDRSVMRETLQEGKGWRES